MKDKPERRVQCINCVDLMMSSTSGAATFSESTNLVTNAALLMGLLAQCKGHVHMYFALYSA